MSPSKLPPKRSPRPTHEIKVPKHAQDSADHLASMREGNKKNLGKKNFNQHRAQQEETETQAHHGLSTQRHTVEQSDRPETQDNNAAPSTANATVNASIDHDPILAVIQKEEREQAELIAWLAQHYPGRDLSTLDMEELEQMRNELGPGPTTEPDHNPYPHVRIEPRLSAASQPSSGHPSRGNTNSQQAPRDIGIEAELGVNTSFDHPQARLKTSALTARPVPRSSGAPTHSRSQPASNTRYLDNHEEDVPYPRHASSQGTLPRVPHVSGSAARPHHLARASHRSKTLAAKVPLLPQACARLAIAQPVRALPQPVADNLPFDPAHFELVTHAVSDRLRDPIPGAKPRRGDWHGIVRQLVDRTAGDAKATLIAAGYMKTAEERELIILQAWERANVYLKQTRPHRSITRRQVRYVQNLFPPCRKLMKTRLEGLVSSEFHLRDGTDDEIHDLVERQLLPHGFHSQHRGGELGPLHFENRFLAEAIAIMIFRDSTDFGLVFNAIFNPIPLQLLTFACAMIADIIGEHTSGAHITKPTRVETLQPLFNTYLGSLGNLRQANLSCVSKTPKNYCSPGFAIFAT
ncbi:hypothetical protein FRC06_006249 [Ceratobasidium sp. 370]|nr:hypothetical protein FRC06_006249 [Ceratobasidium sp. 370]